MPVSDVLQHCLRRSIPLLACVGALLGCGAPAPPESPRATAERGEVERIVVATGTIEPATEVEVRPRIAGIIERIRVAEGDHVRTGQVLVDIERDLLASQVAEAEAALVEAEVAERFAKIELERREKLLENGAASPQQLDDARARYDGAVASKARAQAQRNTLRTQLGYATIHATLDGRVLDVHVEEGNAVSPVTAVTGGTLLLTLAGEETLRLEGLVDENEVARVVVGQRARIQTEAYEDRVFEGVVREIAPLGERVENVTYFKVKVELVDEGASVLRPRMSGDAEIVAETVSDATVIPERALHYRGDEIYVRIPNGEAEPEERDVRVGIVDGDRVQILDGLGPGEEVFLQ